MELVYLFIGIILGGVAVWMVMRSKVGAVQQLLDVTKQQQEEQAAIDQIYADWDRQAKEFAETYRIEGFNLMDEIQNPQFANLLKAGVTVDGAYKAVHFDDMVGGAMAHTAAKVKQDIVNSVNGRAQRPSEGAVASHNATVFKSDVSSLTKEDRAEIRRRAARGETIVF